MPEIGPPDGSDRSEEARIGQYKAVLFYRDNATTRQKLRELWLRGFWIYLILLTWHPAIAIFFICVKLS